MKNRKQLLADFYLDLLALPISTTNNHFGRLRFEVARALANELECSVETVNDIFERMAAEDSK